MTVYLAGPWIAKAQVKEARAKLEAAGIKVRASWIDNHGSDSHAGLQREAIVDFNQILEADALVLLNLAKSEGKATELGYAYGLGKRILVVGRPEDLDRNVFYNLPHIEHFPALEGAIQCLIFPRKTVNTLARNHSALAN